MMSLEFPIPSMHLLSLLIFACHYNKRNSRKACPPYRVLLQNNNYKKWEYDVQVLMEVMLGKTLDIVVNILQKNPLQWPHICNYLC